MMDLTELDKLEALLKGSGVPYERVDEYLNEYGKAIPNFEHHQIFYPSQDPEKRLSDAVISRGSYGHEEGLLEQMGLLGVDLSEFTVEGWLKAEDVFQRWLAHWTESGGTA